MKGAFRSAPSAYNAVPFHLVRFIQFVAAGSVVGTTSFFINHLWYNKSAIPWMFYFLQGAACFTLVWLIVSSILKFLQRLSPTINSIANGFSAAVWIVAFGLLTNRMRWIIFRQCSKSLWATDVGVLVCRLYKVNFSAAIVGIASTVAAFVLDIRTRNKVVRRGKYTTASTTAELNKSSATAYEGGEEDRYNDRAVLLEDRILRTMAPSPDASRQPSPMRTAEK